MIQRYTRPEMEAIWSQASKYRIWFEIEAHGCDALAELGVIPKEAAKTIWEKGGSAEFDVDRIDEIEREVKDDVIAFRTHLAEFIGEDARLPAMVEMAMSDENLLQLHARPGNTRLELVEVPSRIDQRALDRLRAPDQRAILLQRCDGNDGGAHRGFLR